MKYFISALLLAALCNTVLVNSKPTTEEASPADYDVQNDDQYDEEYTENADEDESPPEDQNELIPILESKPQHKFAKQGDKVILPCKVSNLGSYDFIWRKDEKILFQGVMSLTNKKNLNRSANGSLEISNFSSEDAGTYMCQLMISEDIRPSVSHDVKLFHPAKINAMTTLNNRTVYNIGDTLTINCNASGDPKPNILWYKGRNKGEKLSVTGATLTIEGVNHKDSDSYRCFADNGKADHQSINIFVNYKPIVHIEKFVVNSDKELNAELKCSVYAYPAATVNWYKNGELMTVRPPHLEIKKHHHNTILTISNVEESDFGIYSCRAENHFGMVEKNASLVKTPAIQEFIKPDSSSNVILAWRVESKSPIAQHELQYRKKGESEWKVLKPEVSNGDNDIYTIKYTLDNLEAGIYECRVRSQNMHGWSDYSTIMPFEGETQIITAQEGTPAQHQENDKETLVGASQTGGSSTVFASVGLLLVSIGLLLLKDRA